MSKLKLKPSTRGTRCPHEPTGEYKQHPTSRVSHASSCNDSSCPRGSTSYLRSLEPVAKPVVTH